MKKLFTLIAAACLSLTAFSQTDSTVSVVINRADQREFEHRLTYAGHYQEVSGVTQILGLVFAGGGAGLMIAHLKTGKPGYAYGAYGCFGVGGTLLITSAGFKIANGYELRNLRLKYEQNQYSYPNR